MKQSIINKICNTLHSNLCKEEKFMFWTIAAWGAHIAYIGIRYSMSINP